MFKGCMRRMLFVDLSSGKIVEERPDEELYRDFLGGYGIGARVLFSRQRPGVDPLGPDNTLGLVTGLLTGVPVPGGCRYTVVAKSPLTGGWGDANSGGDFGPNLKFSCYDAIFFTGVSEKPVYLVVRDGQAELRDAGHLWGKDTCQTEDILKAELGEEMSIACIGPAGEALSLLSCVINRKGRAAARSGLGAVMGSKRLKAVAVYGKMPVPLADKAEVDRLRREYLPKIKDDQIAVLLKTYGTLSLLGSSGTVASAALSGEAPVKNWGGIGVRDFTKAAASGSEPALQSFEERKYACWRCPVGCGGYMKAGKEYKYARGAHKPEYETVAGFGTMCLNPNLESIIMANDICNRYGLDTISVGATIAFAIECYDNRLITREETGGIELTWGNHRAIVAMTEKLAKREGFGAILADGVKVAAERIGKGSEEYAMHIGGQEVPYHDPRNSPRFAVAYKIDATPARHTQPGADGIGQEQKERNNFGQAYNAAGLCMWLNKALGATAVSEFMSAVTGHPYNVSTLTEAGERIANVRQAFNIREGLNPLERKVPGRVIGIPPQTEGPLAGKTVDLDARVNAYLKAMDWDPETAKPSKKRLYQLGLEDVANAL
jgi:aldehyde:ferredoxin oxidoreductase